MDLASETQQAWILHLRAQGLLDGGSNGPDSMLDGAGAALDSQEDSYESAPSSADTPSASSADGFMDAAEAPQTGRNVLFTPEENEEIARCVSQFCLDNRIAPADFPVLLWNKQYNKKLRSLFWKQLRIGSRSASSVHKRVHRMYLRPSTPSKWTPEADAQLTQLVHQHGAAEWNLVAMHLGRSPEACRDRWRNYLVCGPNRRRLAWTAEETAELLAIIEASSGASLAAGKQQINWGLVSAQMGHRRSRIQCRYRWNKIQQQQASER